VTAQLRDGLRCGDLVLSVPFRARAAHIMQFRLVGVEHSSPKLSYDFRNFAEHSLAPIFYLVFDIGSDSANYKRHLPDRVSPTCMSGSSNAVAWAAQAVRKLRPDSERWWSGSKKSRIVSESEWLDRFVA
jgi:hypothetical protein